MSQSQEIQINYEACEGETVVWKKDKVNGVKVTGWPGKLGSDSSLQLRDMALKL